VGIFLDMFLIVVGWLFDMCWIVLDRFWIVGGHVLDMFLIAVAHLVGVFCIYFWYALGDWWILSGCYILSIYWKGGWYFRRMFLTWCWVFGGCVLDIFDMCGMVGWYVLCVSWYSLDSWWICYGHDLDMCWTVG